MTWLLLGLPLLAFLVVHLIDKAIYRHYPELQPEPEPEPHVVYEEHLVPQVEYVETHGGHVTHHSPF